MNRIGDTKLTKSLGLELQQLLTTVIHGTTDTAIFPARMLQARQLVQLGTNLIGRQAFLGERQVPGYIRPTLYKLGFEVLDRSRDLLVDLAADTGGAEENGVAPETDGDVDIAEAADKAVATKRVKGSARVSDDEEYKYNIAKTGGSKHGWSAMIVAGNGGCSWRHVQVQVQDR